jgi:hypothetical protein
MQFHLHEISHHVAEGAHACSSNAQDGTPRATLYVPPTSPWHTAPERPRTQPGRLSNRVFETYDAIIDAACEA